MQREILKDDIYTIYREAKKAFKVFNQENLPDYVLEEAQQKITAFLPYLDYLIYQYPEDKFPYHLYRVRQEQAISDDESIREACTFSYPSPEKCQVARANREGCPVFYVADNIETALKEASCEKGQAVYLSEWAFVNPKNTLFFLFFGEQLPQKSFWRKAQDNQQEVFKQRMQQLPEDVTKQWNELYNIYYKAFMGENYQTSSIIGHYLLYESTGIQVLVYPSKAHKENNFNLAMHPDFVDAHLQLKRVIKLRITHEQPQISPKILSVGDQENNVIIWRAPLEDEKNLINE